VHNFKKEDHSMKKTQLWKRLAAWTLTAAMVFGNSSFLALAEESTQEVSVDAAGEALQEEADAGSDGWSKDELIEEPEGGHCGCAGCRR
jgi:hypothetical protein